MKPTSGDVAAATMRLTHTPRPRRACATAKFDHIPWYIWRATLDTQKYLRSLRYLNRLFPHKRDRNSLRNWLRFKENTRREIDQMAVQSFSRLGDSAFRRVAQSHLRIDSRTLETREFYHRYAGRSCGSYGRTVLGSEGLAASTCVKTDRGWTAVEEIKAGTFVETFDDGWQPVQTIIRRRVESASTGGLFKRSLVRIAPNVVGNTVDLYLPVGQAVLFESDVAEALFGDPFPLVTAQSLVEANIAEAVPTRGDPELYELRFARSQLVICAGGAIMLSSSQSEHFDDFASIRKSPGRYRVLDELFSAALLRADLLESQINACS